MVSFTFFSEKAARRAQYLFFDQNDLYFFLGKVKKRGPLRPFRPKWQGVSLYLSDARMVRVDIYQF